MLFNPTKDFQKDIVGPTLFCGSKLLLTFLISTMRYSIHNTVQINKRTKAEMLYLWKPFGFCRHIMLQKLCFISHISYSIFHIFSDYVPLAKHIVRDILKGNHN